MLKPYWLRLFIDFFGMIKERLIAIIKWKGIKNPELEELTGISRYTWQNIRNKPDRAIKEEEIEAIAALYPEYRLWLISGEVAPEIGQTSPEYDEANATLKQRGEG